MQWKKEPITLDDGTEAQAQAPVIISASRSTDIPTFYSDWFISRWQKGYIKWTNPFNGKPLYVSFKNTRCVVFWTKNPKPMFKYLDFMEENIPNFYFQYSLNDYDKEGYEAKVATVQSRIETFKELSNRLGKKRVIWRFDPLILTDTIDVAELLRRVKNIGDQLQNYTQKLVFSFADISTYRKVQNNLKKDEVSYIEFTPETMNEFAKGISEINKEWGLELGTCTEKIDLNKYGIVHNKCIDDDLMIELFSEDTELMDFLGVKTVKANLFESEKKVTKKRNLKDKGQRKDCGCVMAKDIGQYNTCPHECNYCYANTSKELAKKNYKLYLENPDAESIVDKK
jgi:DNA repair photolyase